MEYFLLLEDGTTRLEIESGSGDILLESITAQVISLIVQLVYVQTIIGILPSVQQMIASFAYVQGIFVVFASVQSAPAQFNMVQS